MGGRFEATPIDGVTIEGRIVEDTLEIAGLNIPGVSFGLADQPFMPSTHHADGICGLASPRLSAIDENGFFYDMIELELLDNDVFGIALSRQGYSELTLGGVNAALYEDLTFVPVIGQYGLWEVAGSIVLHGRSFTFDFMWVVA